jgi:hypothetical protein
MRQRSERYRPVCCILLASGSRQQQSALALLATPKQRIPSNFLFARGSVGQSLEADFLQGQRSILVSMETALRLEVTVAFVWSKG